MNRGALASSPSTARRRLIAALRLCSKSTNVPSVHTRSRSSSLVTTAPGLRTSCCRKRHGCPRSRVRALQIISSRVGSYTATGSGSAALLSLPDVYVSIEGPHLEFGSTAVDCALDRVVYFDMLLPGVRAQL